MAVEELQVIRLRRDFYRDGFRTILFALSMTILVVILLAAISIYLFLVKPAPVKFATDNEWRIVKPVPVEQPYLPTPDLLQWVSNALPGLFNYDFVNYTDEVNKNEHYFTENGWKKFLALLNNYAAYNTITHAKLFTNGSADGAPFVVNQGLLAGRYSWWVQMSVNINYSGGYVQPLILQVLVVRIPTLNNLYGIAIDNILVPNAKSADSKVIAQ